MSIHETTNGSNGWLAKEGRRQIAAMAEGRYTGAEFPKRTAFVPKHKTLRNSRNELRSIFSSNNPRRTMRKGPSLGSLKRKLNSALLNARTPRIRRPKIQWWNRLSERHQGRTRKNRK